MTISKIKAAVLIFKKYKKPFSSRELVEIALKQKLIKVNGLTPHATMNADILNENKRRKNSRRKPRFLRVDRKWQYIGE